MTKAAAFKLSDVRRAVKAVAGLGLPIHGVEVAPDGTVRVLTGGAPGEVGEDSATVAWEQKHGLRPAPQSDENEAWHTAYGKTDPPSRGRR